MLNAISKEILEINKANGWDVMVLEDVNNKNKIIVKVMLMKSEVSEALEALRKQDKANFAEELADTAIRILDFAAGIETDFDARLRDEHTGKSINDLAKSAWEATSKTFAVRIGAVDFSDPTGITQMLYLIEQAVDRIALVSELGALDAFDEVVLTAVTTVFAVASSLGIDIEAEMRRKMQVNATRGHRHGGKAI